MDFLGIGIPELIVVLVIAIVVLGPARMVDMARQVGKWTREAQRVLRETADEATRQFDVKEVKDLIPREPLLPPDDVVAKKPQEPQAGATPDPSAEQERGRG